MLSSKKFVITIGNSGAIVALHDSNTIKNKIFLEKLDDNAKQELTTLFDKNRHTKIYILLDTLDQTYKKKIYPSIKKSDLFQIIKRDLASDGDKDSLKSHIILNDHKSSLLNFHNNHHTKWECLFISTTKTKEIEDWLTFLFESSNHIEGIYMLPIETFSLFQSIKDLPNIKTLEAQKKIDLYCLILQNKVSGIRQIVFSSQGIVFTRIVDYDFTQPDFLEKYEHDIYSTFEYLKRLYSDILINKLAIINLLPQNALSSISNLKNTELNLINYTEKEIASKLDFNDLTENVSFSDLLISKSFATAKKRILRFTTPTIRLLDRMFIILKTSYYFNLALILILLCALIYSIFHKNNLTESISDAELKKANALQQLHTVKSSTINSMDLNENVSLDRITDLGKMEELFGSIGESILNYYKKLTIIKKRNSSLETFSYSLQNIDYKNPVKVKYIISFSGSIVNKSGDIEDLFREFDNLTIDIKNSFTNNQVTYSELPRNIDFGKKYYEFPIQFSISSQ